MPLMTCAPTPAAPHARPPPINFPPTDAKAPESEPPTAAGDGFVHTDDEKDDSNLDSDEEAELFALPYVDLQEKRRNAAIFGFQRTKKKVNDPFDFVERLPEDPPYEEMGETARLWKIFLQERGKVDADKAANWKDALDVLLVFAGLFSTVVSSFVSQTYQSLQVDNVQIVASLVVELVNVQRAIGSGLDVNDVATTDLTSDFHPARSALWVNGLWFISLVLSLTAAMVAGLTKQWVNEYLDSAQVGTPRTLSRIRQFRAVQLEAWHVPVIIGLLPVLMHVSLGVFLAGLIIFLFTLSTPLTIAISFVVAGTLATYLSTNILPLYDPSCPYKTPLTSYIIYTLYHRLRQLELCGYWPSFLWPEVANATTSAADDTDHFAMPASLKEAEETIVLANVDVLDAQAAVWLHETSADSAIHRSVLEAISNLPLTGTPFVRRRIQSLEVVLREALKSSHYTRPDNTSAYQRIFRSFLRLFPKNHWEGNSAPSGVEGADETFPILVSNQESNRAADFLSTQIMGGGALHDAAVWAQILRNALSSGSTTWLHRGCETPWWAILEWLMVRHTCSRCAATAIDAVDTYTVKITCDNDCYYSGQEISILPSRSCAVSTATAMNFEDAVTNFMIPSLSSLFIRIMGVPDLPGPSKDIPSHAKLVLSLIHLPDIQATSAPGNSFSAAAKVITCIKHDLGINSSGSSAYLCDERVPEVAFKSLKRIFDVDIDTGNALCSRDRRSLLHAMFRVVALDPRLVSDYRLWMDEEMSIQVITLLFDDPSGDNWAFLADVLGVIVAVQCKILLPKVYTRICETRCLDTLRTPGS